VRLSANKIDRDLCRILLRHLYANATNSAENGAERDHPKMAAFEMTVPKDQPEKALGLAATPKPWGGHAGIFFTSCQKHEFLHKQSKKVCRWKFIGASRLDGAKRDPTRA
jgi:hypothetical protein